MTVSVRSLAALPGVALLLAGAQANAATPTISGSAPTSVAGGGHYNFQPVAADADGDTLTFSVANKPGWAWFNSSTGALYGWPSTSAVGTYGNIVISVSDGRNSRSLPAFNLAVTNGSTSSSTPPATTSKPTTTTTASSSTTSATASASGNIAPAISGTPPTWVAGGGHYNFQPVAADGNGDKLTFSVTNKPGWAWFSASTGALYGWPSTAVIGNFSNIVITVSDGKASKSLPAFSVAVTNGSAPSSSTSNHAPTISGAAVTSVTAGSAYSFRPSASDADNNTLAYSIANKPTWLSFNTATGALTGTPATANIGSYSAISISVSDGKASAALPAFGITVRSTASTSTGAATISWLPPTRNADGSTLTNLAGYRIVYGKTASALDKTVQIANPGLSSYMVENLSAGTYYFAVKAYTSSGSESAQSQIVSKSL
jgi:hypothetical protein